MTKNETPSSLRNRIGAGLLAAAFAFLIGAIVFATLSETESPADPDNSRQVVQGKPV